MFTGMLTQSKCQSFILENGLTLVSGEGGWLQELSLETVNTIAPFPASVSSSKACLNSFILFVLDLRASHSIAQV